MVQNRSGLTIVSSVSLSKEFKQLMEMYHISPTDAMRRGIAVTLSDMGVNPYDNPLNKKRIENSQKIIASIREQEIIKGTLIKLKKILEELNNF